MRLRFNHNGRQRMTHHSRRLAIESLESREMLSATPQFQVVDDASANLNFRYSLAGAAQGSTALAAADSAPRGITSSVGLEKTWVIDANRNVYVYSAAGSLLGSWSAGSMANNATPEGIATDGTDIWIADSRSDKVYRYSGAAGRLSGSQTAASSIALYGTDPKDIATDGSSLWVVDDGKKVDKVYVYSAFHGGNGPIDLLGSWTIDAANKSPTGITLDPANIGDIWITDSGTDRVYKYSAAASRFSGSQPASSSFALSSADGNSQGIIVPGRAWAETPYQVSWVRQFGTTANDWGRGISVDAAGNIYVSGAVNATNVGTPYLSQFDSAGNLHWTQYQAVSHEGVRVATDSLGNVFQINGSGGTRTDTSLNNYDANGTLRWSINLPAGEGVFNVAADDLGYAYTSTYESNNIHIRKFDGATGALVWERQVDTGGITNSSGISADHMGNIYVTAYTAGSLLGPNAGNDDALVLKYSDAGQLLWSKQYGSPGDDLAFYVAPDAFGNVYSGGRTDGSIGGANVGGVDTFLAKQDAAGNLLWTRQYGTTGDDTRADMWVDPQGNVYRAIVTTGSLGGAHLGVQDIVVAKFDPNGNVVWATQVGTSGDDNASGGIWGDAQGNLYVTGYTTGSWGGVNAGGQDAFVIKLSPPAALKTGAAKALMSTAAQTISVSTVTSSDTHTSSGQASLSRASSLVSATVNGVSSGTTSVLNCVSGATSSLQPKMLQLDRAVATDHALEELQNFHSTKILDELLPWAS